MLFRFSLFKNDDQIDIRSLEFKGIDDAIAYVCSLLLKEISIKAITLHQHLTDDSCGPIKYIGTFILKDTQVINIYTKETL